MALVQVSGNASSETFTAPNGTGQDFKYDAKGGNDVIIASTGDDLLIGGAGSDVLFGGAGKDTFEFSKFANAGDTDYITDFSITNDTFKFGAGVTISSAVAVNGPNFFNGQNLVNDAKVMDLILTLDIVDGDKVFQQTVTLLDVIKNQTWSADQFEAFLSDFGFTGEITFA